MLDATATKIVKLLDNGQPADVRATAARILGLVGGRDAETARALLAAASDPEATVRLAAIDAIAKLRVEQALPQLLAKVSAGGTESEAAAHAAARLGSKGTRALQELMHQVAPGLRRRIAAALATGGTASGNSAAVNALLDSDPGVVDAAVRSLISEIPTLSQAQRRVLVDHVLELVKPRKGAGLPPASEAALIRLLSALGDSRTEAVFWSRIGRGVHVDLRVAALQALGALPPPKNKEKLADLFTCAADADFRVAAPALMILKSVPVLQRNVKDWLALFRVPDVAVRRFAIEKLAGQESIEVAEALLQQLDHPDRGLRDLAVSRLAVFDRGRTALAEALIHVETPERAWNLARAQSASARSYSPKLLTKLFAQAFDHLEEGDRRAEPFLFLLREVDARGLRDKVEERALALRKKKDYATALIYLRFLARDPACAEEIRFEMAACSLKLAEHDLSAEVRTAEPSLQQFARLIRSHETDPGTRLKAARWLSAGDLYYLGFHFIEGERQDREFGVQALRLVLTRSPGSKLARDAKSKLKSAGLEKPT
jgi:HEAT repeat protein